MSTPYIEGLIKKDMKDQLRESAELMEKIALEQFDVPPDTGPGVVASTDPGKKLVVQARRNRIILEGI